MDGSRCILMFSSLVRSLNRGKSRSGLQEVQARCLTSASAELRSQLLTVSYEGESHVFPLAWLRDNCPKGFHPTSKARHFLLRDMCDVDKVKEEHVSVDQKNGEVKISWPDGHHSVFPREWLLERSFNEDNRRRRLKRFAHEPQLWGAADGKVRKHAFSQIMADNSAMLSWLTDLETFGLTLVTGIPDERSGYVDLCDKVAFAKSTHYGDKFVVEDKPDPNNLAYTSATLGLHMDLPFYEYTPGVQFLHCIRQHSGSDGGGENEFADAFFVAERMRREHPEQFKLLTEQEVEFWDEGVERDEEGGRAFHKVTNLPTISLDSFGRVSRVHYNNQVRSSRLNVASAADADRLYDALINFDRIAYENVVLHKMEPGECVAFDNRRVLHGRRGFQSRGKNADGQGRRLVGWYMDWDEIWSMVNVLKEEARAK